MGSGIMIIIHWRRNAIVGPHSVVEFPGLNGFSGHGVQQAAFGARDAEWMPMAPYRHAGTESYAYADRQTVP